MTEKVPAGVVTVGDMSRTSNVSTDQHYVPQLLLRGFATRKRKQVYTFDKQGEKVFRSSVRNLACERGFYDLENDGDPKHVDRWLTRLEEQTAPIIKSIRRPKGPQSFAPDRAQMDCFIHRCATPENGLDDRRCLFF